MNPRVSARIVGFAGCGEGFAFRPKVAGVPRSKRHPAPGTGFGERGTRMDSMAADPRPADKSDARRQFPDRLGRVLQSLADEIRDGDLTEHMADAPAQDRRNAWSSRTGP